MFILFCDKNPQSTELIAAVRRTRFSTFPSYYEFLIILPVTVNSVATFPTLPRLSIERERCRSPYNTCAYPRRFEPANKSFHVGRF